MNQNYEFLPIGSVVLLKEAKRKVVIIGFGVVEDGSKVVWDYLGCAYPIGVVSSDSNLLFNRDQIEELVSVGYVDEEGKKFIGELSKNMEMIKKNG